MRSEAEKWLAGSTGSFEEAVSSGASLLRALVEIYIQRGVTKKGNPALTLFVLCLGFQCREGVCALADFGFGTSACLFRHPWF